FSKPHLVQPSSSNPPLSLSNVTVFSATLARDRVLLAMLSRSRFSPGRILLTCRSNMMVGWRRTAELPVPVPCDSPSCSTVSTARSVWTTGSPVPASPVSTDTAEVVLNESPFELSDAPPSAAPVKRQRQNYSKYVEKGYKKTTKINF
uniref:Uncharacterized protein n=1 Tax=Gouania willdenowi TaxID=441366 RepID=A0A8C5GKU9_GOUWI